MDHEKIKQAVTMILEAVGEDPNREGLVDTPARVARMYEEIFAGLHMDPASVLSAKFHVDEDEMVFVKDITFYSMCEHHLLPFFGKAHVAYLPSNGVVTGLSKLARLVEAVATRPQVQERMTNEIAEVLHRELQTQGVMVIVEAEHLCMNMRGVRKPGSQTVTMAKQGRYNDEPALADQVFRMLKS
ncbi:GTP cyclohydrolase I FolE [Alicyclobacillus sp. SO9]|uniref:GTP cyclohydrolase I FolE n=1 Tax=Alicyclobacillus sp. SO9 TaxID=2665646 RepID=UPI001E6264F8|nr:GTP cyclohydrolase I FolE [Alicyclobacillus sp. SO9]